MKQFFSVLICTVVSLGIFTRSDGQVTVFGASNTTPALASSYTSLANAITALDAITAISGQVTLTVTGDETAPAGGYVINFTAATTASNNVIIDGSSGYYKITASSSLTAGSRTDAIFKIVGSDYVTITRFIMQENTANTTTSVSTNNMTEWGVALLRASTTNGAQYNSIIGNAIKLDRTYPNSVGIYSNVRHTAGSDASTADIANGSTAPNHGNKVYSNKIGEVSLGIAFIGSGTNAYMDNFNDIGGSSSSTGNGIADWGGNSLVTTTFYGNMNTEYYGILMKNQKDNNISWNAVTSSTSLSGSVAAPVRGIHNAISGTVTGIFNTTINYNTVSLSYNLPNGSTSTSRLDGILNSDALGSATLNISHNTISGLAVTTSGSNCQIRCIANGGAAAAVYIDSNMIRGNTSTATAMGSMFTGIEQTGTITDRIAIDYNSIGDSLSSTPAITYSATAHSGAALRGINNNPSNNPSGTTFITICHNCFYGFVTANSPANQHAYIFCNHTTTGSSGFRIDYNHFINLDAHTTGDVLFIRTDGTMSASAGSGISVAYNDIIGTFTKSLSGGDVYLFKAGGTSGTGNTMMETNNNFSNISLMGTTIMHGWYDNEGATATGPEKHITDNVFDSWACGTTVTSGTVNAIYCDWASDSSEISGNTISNIMAYCELDAIFSASNTAVTLNANRVFQLDAVCSPLSAITMGTNSSAGNGGIYLNPGFATEVIGYNLMTNGSTPGTIGIYYNTVFLNATDPTATCPTISNFNTSCQVIKANANANVDRIILRNNIYINTSDYKGTGKAACIINKGSLHTGTIPNYSSPTNISNNNVFWVGTRSTVAFPHSSTILKDTHHVIYNDNRGTNVTYDRQNVDTFKVFVGSPKDSLSFSYIPDFVSSIPTDSLPNADLHLVYSTWNCPLFDHANSEGIYAPIAAFDGPIYGHTKRLIVCPFITDIGCDQRIKTYTWKGTNSTDWNDPNNWDLYALNPSLYAYPDSTAETAYIPATTSGNQPIISSGTRQVDNLLTQCSATPGVSLLTNWGAIKVAKQILGAFGTVSNHNGCATVGSIEVNGSCDTQRIDGRIFTPGIAGGDVNNFTASNTSAALNPKVIVTDSGELNIYGELGFGATGQTLKTSPALADSGITLKSGEFCPGVFTTANVAKITGSNVISGNVRVERYINTGTTGSQHLRSWQFLATPTGYNATAITGQSVYESWQESGTTPVGYGAWISGDGTGFDVYSADPGMKYWNPLLNSGAGDWEGITNTGNKLYDKRGYMVFARGDRSITLPGDFPIPTNLRSKGPICEPTNPPPSTSVGANETISVGNPYASAIDLIYMRDNNLLQNLDDYVYVWDPLLYGSAGFGGYQILIPSNDYEPTAGGTTYYPTGVQHPDIQSGQAFFVLGNGTTSGSVSFNENCKISGNRLVFKSAASDRQFFRATLYAGNGVIADGNATIFSSTFSDAVDRSDGKKLMNPGENFMIRKQGRYLSVEARQPLNLTDTIYYTFSHLTPQEYQLKFAPKNMPYADFSAYLIDAYLNTSRPISLQDSSIIQFTVTNQKSTFENRFMVVFGKKDLGLSYRENPGEKNKDAITLPSMHLYPTLIQNHVGQVKLEDFANGQYQMKVINSTGQIIYERQMNVTTKYFNYRLELDKSIPPGGYSLLLSSKDGEKWTQRFIIQ